ncbi:MAG: MarR family winged helix-turn-helix transcriptional regulator [Clostridium sp.]|nr:MarR family winged helix-turn-helix transcriptional regulator [Clostridium sp.]
MSKRIDNTSCHCLKMRRSAENVVHFYDNVLAPSGVTVRQYSLIRAVFENNGCNVRELAEATLLDRSTLARSLKPLIQSGYIEDKKEGGARDSILELSQIGISICKQCDELWEMAQLQFEEKIGKERLIAFENTLTLLQDL